MNNTFQDSEHRELCRQRDKEFLALYNPTLDALLEQGMAPGKARRAAAEFTITNGHPHYHVGHERAYRYVCRLLSDHDKKGNGARSYRSRGEMDLAKRRLRQQMWYEITSHVRELTCRGMSIETAIDHVLEHCRASRFFISPATALTKICPAAHTRTYRL